MYFSPTIKINAENKEIFYVGTLSWRKAGETTKTYYVASI
jgi:hypothetical protein